MSRNYDPTRQLTEPDWEVETEALSKGVETASDGALVESSNAETGNSGTITPRSRFNAPAGSQYRKIRATFKCKPYEIQYAVTVCHNADGDWKVTQTD